MRKIFAPIICFFASLIPKPGFSEITFWKSRNKKYLYYCMSEEHIDEEKDFRKIFPNSDRISQMEFDTLIYFYPERKVIHIADEHILADLQIDETEEQEAVGGETKFVSILSKEELKRLKSLDPHDTNKN